MRIRQRGQALPLGIALILCATLGGFVLYDTGRSATDKARVVNAADAASYSGLVWQARALNFQAYTNRAMVANQVSMAQAVSLQSWANYGAITSQNLELVLGKVPYIGPIFVAGARAMDGVNRVVKPVADVMLGLVDAVNVGLSHAQGAMFASSFAATPEIIRAVAHASDPRFTADTAFSVIGALGNLGDWERFTDRVGRDERDAMRERADIIRGSRDAFTAERDWELLPVDLFLGFTSYNVDRQGATKLVEAVDADGNLQFEWKAKDTISLDLGHLSLWKGWDHTDVPIGWAEAYANSAKSERTIERGVCTEPGQAVRAVAGFGASRCARQHWLGPNENAELLADTGVKFGRNESRTASMRYSGINPFRNLSESTMRADFPTLRLKVEVALDADAVRSSGALGATGRFDTGYRAPGNVISSVSVAEVFFKPPMADRTARAGTADGRIEFANAYGPWWDVRLAPVSETDRMLAFTLRDHRDTRIGGARAPGAGGGAASLASWDGTSGDVSAGASVLDAARGLREYAHATGAAQEIRERLVDAAGDAARDMLSGLVGDARKDLEGWAREQSGIDADAARATYERAQGRAERASAEAERVRELLETDVRDLVDARIRDAFGVEAGLLDALGDPAAADEDVRAARDRLDELEHDLVRELGREIVERVDRITEELEIDESMARHFVRLMIKTLRDEATEGEDFVPFGEDGVRTAGEGEGPDAPAATGARE